MGVFSRLFGSGELPREAPVISKTRDSGDTKDIWQRIEQEALIDQTTSKILRDYGQVLEAINEQRNGYVRGLHPESKLPYPKEVIRAAFAIAFKQMERYGWQQWNGVPKNVLEMAATSLDIHFAPDQEVPDDPIENFAAFNKRQLEQSPEIHAKVFASLKANPEG